MARDSRPLRRKPGSATEAETIAMVCEGTKTEGLYFNGIRRKFRITTAQLHVVELGADPVRVVQEAESLRSGIHHRRRRRRNSSRSWRSRARSAGCPRLTLLVN
jgi:hypothetical protein